MREPNSYADAYLNSFGLGENPALAEYFRKINQFKAPLANINNAPAASIPQDMQDFAIGGPNERLFPRQVFLNSEMYNPAMSAQPDISEEIAQLAAERADAKNGGPSYEAGAQGSSNPIEKGVQSALEARKQRLGLDEDQKREALGHALMGFFSNYASSKQEGNLARINESFNPALGAWVAEKERAKALNKDEFNAEQDIKKLEQHERLKQQELALDQQRVNIALKEHERKLKQNAFHEMTPYQQETVMNRLYERSRRISHDKSIELENYIKNNIRASESGDERDQKIAAKQAEIDKKYSKDTMLLEREMNKWGLDYSSIGQSMPQEGNIPESFNKPEVKNGIDISKIPRKADGSFDLSGLTIEQKRMLAGE